MNKVKRKLSAAIRLLKSSGISGCVEYCLGSSIAYGYSIGDKYLKEKPSGLSICELGDFLTSVGIGANSSILLHSSWDSLKESSFTPLELIDFLRNFLGPKGTIAMPSYTGQSLEDGVVLDVDGAVSKAGWISEVFRRTPGVIRSANIAHPVCALGPLASFLIDNHHKGSSPWDQNSPYFRIGAQSDNWIVGVGVHHKLRVATSLHCVESLMSEHPYFRKLFPKQISYEFVSDRHGTGWAITKLMSGVIFPGKIHKFFKGKIQEKTINGVDLYAIRARDLIEVALEVGARGKVMHIWPVPWFWLFRSSKSIDAREMLDNLYDLMPDNPR